MVRLETLAYEGKIEKITDLEIDRYVNFFQNSYQDNQSHSKANLDSFPRWSIISGYYAMHDITKLLLAKQFRVRIVMEVHATTIKVLRELIKNREITDLIEKGYHEFISLANDLAEAKKERVKAQYYTGTEFMKEEYRKKAIEFQKTIVLVYLEKIKKLVTPYKD